MPITSPLDGIDKPSKVTTSAEINKYKIYCYFTMPKSWFAAFHGLALELNHQNLKKLVGKIFFLVLGRNAPTHVSGLVLNQINFTFW